MVNAFVGLAAPSPGERLNDKGGLLVCLLHNMGRGKAGKGNSRFSNFSRG
jgi:hypothetical protein